MQVFGARTEQATRQSPELARTFAEVDAVASATGLTSVSDDDSDKEKRNQGRAHMELTW